MTAKLAPCLLLLFAACSNDPTSVGGAIGNVETEPRLTAPEKTIAAPPIGPTKTAPTVPEIGPGARPPGK